MHNGLGFRDGYRLCGVSVCARCRGGSAALSASELAKEISNPVTSIWQLQFQFNNLKLESGDFSPVSGEWVNNLYFQPVMPVSLTKGANLITRPVITLYQSVPLSHGDW